jgi:small subunit ribosomal protein S27Ae
MAEKEKKGKPQKKGKTLQRWKFYEVAGSALKRKNKFCPKCSEGNFLGKHENRLTCGKCGYSEITSSKEDKK